MGVACGCSSYQDSETFLKQFFSASCFQSLTTSAIDSILFYRIRGGNDIIYKINLEITEETYGQIVNDILSKNYHGIKQTVQVLPSKADENQELLQSFLTKLFAFIDINNSVNCLLFKLIMCVFTLKPSLPLAQNVNYFYQILKCVNLSNKDSDMTIKVIPYPQFCESLIYYLSVVLSGFTKILTEILNEENSDEIVRTELIANLNEVYSREMVSQYYSERIIPNFVKTMENVKYFTTLEAYSVTLEDVDGICKDNPQLINYLMLREDFIKFAHEKQNFVPK